MYCNYGYFGWQVQNNQINEIWSFNQYWTLIVTVAFIRTLRRAINNNPQMCTVYIYTLPLNMADCLGWYITLQESTLHVCIQCWATVAIGTYFSSLKNGTAQEETPFCCCITTSSGKSSLALALTLTITA